MSGDNDDECDAEDEVMAPVAVAWVVVRDRARDILVGLWGIEMGRMDVCDIVAVEGQMLWGSE